MNLDTNIRLQTVAQIMDSGFSLLPRFFVKKVLAIFLVISICSALVAIYSEDIYSLLETYDGGALVIENMFSHLRNIILLNLLNWMLLVYASILFIKLSSNIWISNKLNFSKATKDIKISLLFRIIALQLVIVIGALFRASFCLFFALFIPIVLMKIDILTSTILALLSISPAIIYWANRLLASYILILENQTIFSSLARSKKLMTTHPGINKLSLRTPLMRVSAILLLNTILAIGAAFMLGISEFEQELGISIVGTMSIAIIIISQLLLMLVSVIKEIMMVGFYYDLRNRSEALDLHLRLDKISTQ